MWWMLAWTAWASGVLRDDAGVVPLQDLHVQVEVTGRIAEGVATYAFGPTVGGDATFEASLPEGAVVAGLRYRDRMGEWVTASASPGGPGPEPTLDTAVVLYDLSGAAVRVELTWQKVLSARAGAVEMAVPLNDGGTNPLGVPVTMAFDVLGLEPVLEATLSPDGEPTVDGHDVQATWTGGLDDAPAVTLTWREDAAELAAWVLAFRPAVDPFTGIEAPDGYAVAVLQPGAVDPEDRVDKLFTFVLDTSASMSGHPLAVATEAGGAWLESLEPADRFNLVPYTSHPLPFRARAVTATEEHVDRARAFLDRQRATGLSDPAEALVTALDLEEDTVQSRGFFGCAGTALGPEGDAPPLPDSPVVTEAARAARVAPYVVWLTDGGASTGRLHPVDIVQDVAAANRVHASLFAVGVGDAADRELLRSVAASNRGEAQFATTVDDVPAVIAALQERIADPLLVAPAVEVPGASLQAPAALPDLTGGHEVVVAFRYATPGDASLSLTGIRGTEDVDEVFEIDLPAADPLWPAVARAWAQLRLADLEARYWAGDTGVYDQILSLVETYGVASDVVPLGFDAPADGYGSDYGAGCGCGGSAAPVLWPLLPVALLIRRRRTRGIPG